MGGFAVNVGINVVKCWKPRHGFRRLGLRVIPQIDDFLKTQFLLGHKMFWC